VQIEKLENDLEEAQRQLTLEQDKPEKLSEDDLESKQQTESI